MFVAPIRPNSQILWNPSFIASLIISILGFRLGSILIILMSSMPPQLSETFELLISILSVRLGSGLIILLQVLRSWKTFYDKTASQFAIVTYTRKTPFVHNPNFHEWAPGGGWDIILKRVRQDCSLEKDALVQT